jgi:hypothetical protein
MIGRVEWGGINPRRRGCRSVWDTPRSFGTFPGKQIFGVLGDLRKGRMGTEGMANIKFLKRLSGVSAGESRI